MSFDNPILVNWRHLHYVYFIYCISISTIFLPFFLTLIVNACHLSTDTIYVRVYESRMDLLRAVIVGAEGTPYHDGLFFFDVYFPSNYPSVPPVSFFIGKHRSLSIICYRFGNTYLILLLTVGALPFWWASNKSQFVQLR